MDSFVSHFQSPLIVFKKGSPPDCKTTVDSGVVRLVAGAGVRNGTTEAIAINKTGSIRVV